MTAALAEASKSLHIDVNPRYGAWDDRQVRLGTYESPWLAKPPGTEDAAALPGGDRPGGVTGGPARVSARGGPRRRRARAG